MQLYDYLLPRVKIIFHNYYLGSLGSNFPFTYTSEMRLELSFFAVSKTRILLPVFSLSAVFKMKDSMSDHINVAVSDSAVVIKQNQNLAYYHR